MVGPTFGLALVGVNARAQRLLLPGFAASPYCRVTAVCSRTRDKAAQAAEVAGVPAAYDDLADALADPAVDAVFVNTPDHTHYSVVMQTIEAGKHVICEKPLADTYLRAEEMVRAARLANLRTVVNFTLRSLPGPRLLSRLIRDGDLGVLTSFELTTLQSRGYDPRQSNANALADLGPHLLDLLLWWASDAGAGTVCAVATTSTALEERVPKDNPMTPHNVVAQSLVRLDGGASGTINIIRVAPGHGNAYRTYLYGTKATIELSYDTDQPIVRIARGVGQIVHDAWTEVPLPEDLNVRYADFPAFHCGRMAAAIVGVEPFPTFADGLRVQKVLEAMAAAARSRAWVTIDS